MKIQTTQQERQNRILALGDFSKSDTIKVVPHKAAVTTEGVFSIIYYWTVTMSTVPHGILSFGVHYLRHNSPCIMTEILSATQKANILIQA